MGRLKLNRFWSDFRLRIWVLTVLPTSAVFLSAALVLRYQVREKLESWEMVVGHNLSLTFDSAFPGTYIFTGFAVSLLASTLLTFVTLTVVERYYQNAIRVFGEIARGHYSRRLPVDGHMVSTVRDLAVSLNSLAASLEQSDRVWREDLTVMAHELRTPLTTLQAYLEALRDGVIPRDTETLESVHEEVIRLNRLMEPLYQLSRADAFCRKLPPLVPVDVDDLTKAQVRLFEPVAEGRGQSLTVTLGAADVLATGHADAVSRVIHNLLSNAVRYAGDGGRIEIETGRTDGAYQFVCRNTGEMIPPEELPQIFERFYQAGNAPQAGRPGMGVGLAIARQLVEAMGGHIGVASGRAATTFWFDLPLAQ